MEKSQFTEAQIAYVLRRAASKTSASHCCLRKNREFDTTTRRFPTEQTVQMACILTPLQSQCRRTASQQEIVPLTGYSRSGQSSGISALPPTQRSSVASLNRASSAKYACSTTRICSPSRRLTSSNNTSK